LCLPASICPKAFIISLSILLLKIYICIPEMHEFSIAVNIVEIATDYAGRENAKVVKEIEIEVGELSGVVVDALEFCMEAAVKDSILEGAETSISFVPGKARCNACSHEFKVHDFFTVCPKCNTPAPEVIEGRELRVKSLLVE
jgi:hydrogenase nickel incorporation protein HypA/HybF